MIKQFKHKMHFLHASFLIAKGFVFSFCCCYIFLPQVQTLNFGDVLFGSSRWTNMSKHLIFRGSCEYECYHPYFVNIITKFGITPQVFAINRANFKSKTITIHACCPVFLYLLFFLDLYLCLLDIKSETSRWLRSGRDQQRGRRQQATAASWRDRSIWQHLASETSRWKT